MTLTLKNITYSYKEDFNTQTILNDINYTFEAGKLYTIMGPSGAGKTTLLSIAAGLTTPGEGEILYGDYNENIYEIGITKYRREFTSIIFQAYNLIPYMNSFQNIKTALEIKKQKVLTNQEYIEEKLQEVGIIQQQIYKNINQLSGGQQQRVAIARALATKSPIIFADEPTGNLDQEKSQEIMFLFKNLAKLENKCIIIVTHDYTIAQQADIQLLLKDRQLKEVRKK